LLTVTKAINEILFLTIKAAAKFPEELNLSNENNNTKRKAFNAYKQN